MKRIQLHANQIKLNYTTISFFRFKILPPPPYCTPATTYTLTYFTEMLVFLCLKYTKYTDHRTNSAAGPPLSSSLHLVMSFLRFFSIYTSLYVLFSQSLPVALNIMHL